MTRKWWLVVLGVAVGGLAGWSLLSLYSLPRTPLRAKYDQVRLGMTDDQVHAIMDDSSFETTYWYRQGDLEVFTNVQLLGSFTWLVPPEGREWACIQFGNGRVTRKIWGDPDKPKDWHWPRFWKCFGR
jgi:hypothetical protein